MMPLHFFRRAPESLREGRLVFQMRRPAESPPENPESRAERQHEQVSKALADLAVEHPEPRGIDIAFQVLGTEPDVFQIALDQSRTLPEQQQKVIRQNLEDLKKRTKDTEREKIEQLQRSVSVVRATAPAAVEATPPVESAVPSEKPWYERLWDGTKEKAQEGWKRTREWTKENPKLTIAIGATLGVGLLFGLWKWWKHRGEKKAEQPEKKESWLRRVLPWIPVVGLLAAGYWAYKNWSSVREVTQQAEEWWKKKKGGVESALQTTGEAAAVAGGAGAGVTIEAAGLATHGGGVAASSLEVAKDAAGLILEYCRRGETDKAVEKLQESGGVLVQRGKEFFLWWGGELIRLPQAYYNQWEKFLTEGGNFWDLGMVIGEFGTLYVFNAGVARLLFTGATGRFGYHTIGRVIGAPILLIRDGAIAAHAVTWDREALKVKFGGILGRRVWQELRAERLARRFSETGSLADLQTAVQRWHSFDREVAIAGQRNARRWGLRFDESFTQGIGVKRQRLGEKIRKALRGLKELPPDAPPWLRELWGAREFSEKEYNVVLGRALSGMDSAAAESAASSVRAVPPASVPESGAKVPEADAGARGSAPKKPSDAAATVDEGGPVRRPVPQRSEVPERQPWHVVEKDGTRRPVGSPGANVPEGATATRAAQKTERQFTRLLDDPRWAKILGQFNGKVSTGDIDALLQLAGEAKVIDLDAKTLALIRQSGKAKEIIAGAVETTDVAEVGRALKAAKMAAGLRVAGNTLGFAGDAFGVVMAYCDWQENSRKIAETSNPALKELYKDMKVVYATEGGTSAAGIVIGGVAIIKAWAAGEGVLAAFGASAGLIMLPIAAATLSGRLISNQMYAVAETWTKAEQDWVKHHEGDLLNQLQALGPGQNTYWQGSGRTSLMGQAGRKVKSWVTFSGEDYRQWQNEIFRQTESSNEASRFQITRAFLRRTVMLSREENESDEQYRRRFDDFIAEQAKYIGYVTNGNFSRQMMPVYRQAETFAELALLSKKLRAQGKAQMLPIQKVDVETGKQSTVEFDLAKFDQLLAETSTTSGSSIALKGKDGVSILEVLTAYEQSQMENTTVQLNVMKQLTAPEHTINTAIQQLLLRDLRFDFTLLESKLLAANFRGWEWTGGEDKTRDVIRVIVQYQLRGLLRQEADRLVAQTSPITASDFAASLSRLQAYLHQDAAKFEAEVDRQQNRDLYVKEAAEHRETLAKEGATTQQLLSVPWLAQHLYLVPPKGPVQAGIGRTEAPSQ